MEYKIRSISEGEYILLNDFLYEAVFVPPGISPPPKSIINQPELQVYIADFGTKKDDIGLIAEVNNRSVRKHQKRCNLLYKAQIKEKRIEKLRCLFL